jgi:hypothetical protein
MLHAVIVAALVASVWRSSTLVRSGCSRTSTILDASRPMSQSESNRAMSSISAVTETQLPVVRSAESNRRRKRRRKRGKDHEGQPGIANGSLASPDAATDDKAPDERRPSKRRRRSKPLGTGSIVDSSKTKAENSLATNEPLPAKNEPVEMLSISRDFIQQQPLLEWTGSIKILNTMAEMKAAVKEDYEGSSKFELPSFGNGYRNKTSLQARTLQSDCTHPTGHCYERVFVSHLQTSQAFLCATDTNIGQSEHSQNRGGYTR